VGHKLNFRDICSKAAAIRCRQGGQSNAQIAKSAKVAPGTVGKWVNKSGFKLRGGKLRHQAESASDIVDKLLDY